MNRLQASFSDFALLCKSLESTQSRKTLTAYLATFFNTYDKESVIIAIYLLEGLLCPAYKPLNLGVSDLLMIDVLAELSQQEKSNIKQLFNQHGDIGIVAELIESIDFQHVELMSLSFLHKTLMECARIQGDKSQFQKREILLSLLRPLNQFERKYAARIMAGTMRLGVSDATIIKALALSFNLAKSQEEILLRAYRLQSDLGIVTNALFNNGIEGLLAFVDPSLHIPLQPALTERLENAAQIIEKVKLPCIAQPKYDGLRIQVHIDFEVKKISYFSRNLLPMHDMFPDLEDDFFKLSENNNLKNIILDGEIIGFDFQTQEYKSFQETSKRRRIHDVADHTKSYPIRFVAFDCLYKNNLSCMHYPYYKRLELINSLIGQCGSIISIPSTIINSAQELDNYYLKYITAGYEGIIIKDFNAPYNPGKRSYAWIKWKRIHNSASSDTVDAVILGYYYGKGKRSERGIGAFLAGLYNQERECFQTIAKIGTGLNEVAWKELRQECDKIQSLEIPLRVMCKKSLYPDVWCHPQIVVSLKADELTKSSEHTTDIDNNNGYGLALRFPRLFSIRKDKSAYQTTSVKELSTIYKERSLPCDEKQGSD